MPSPVKAKSRQTIGLQPFSSNGSDNPYVDRMAELLSHLGEVTPFPSVRQFLQNPFKVIGNRWDIVVLSWSENFAFTRSGRFSILRQFLLILYVGACKLTAKKLVWIKHNHYPHKVTDEKERLRAARVIKRMELFADIVITHSPLEADGGKKVYVPHPLYENEIDARNPVALESYYFIFGHIASYKNIDLAIQLCPDDVNLVIAGPAKNAAYLAKCQLLAAKKSNVVIIPGFLDSKKAARVAADSCGIIVLNADKDMIVSGSYIYALSLKSPLLAVETPYISWLANQRLGGVFAYSSIQKLFSSLSDLARTDETPDFVRVAGMFGDDVVRDALGKAIR